MLWCVSRTPKRNNFNYELLLGEVWTQLDLDGGASDPLVQYSLMGIGNDTPLFAQTLTAMLQKAWGVGTIELLIPLELPMKKREEGRLTIEMMERNITTSNTLVGSHVFQLYDRLMLAYRRQSSVFPLKERKEVLKRMAKAKSKAAARDDPNDDGIESEEDLEGDADEELESLSPELVVMKRTLWMVMQTHPLTLLH